MAYIDYAELVARIGDKARKRLFEYGNLTAYITYRVWDGNKKIGWVEWHPNKGKYNLYLIG